jgi:hypothetical protein
MRPNSLVFPRHVRLAGKTRSFGFLRFALPPILLDPFAFPLLLALAPSVCLLPLAISRIVTQLGHTLLSSTRALAGPLVLVSSGGSCAVLLAPEIVSELAAVEERPVDFVGQVALIAE